MEITEQSQSLCSESKQFFTENQIFFLRYLGRFIMHAEDIKYPCEFLEFQIQFGEK